jgi:hypothetical protein
MPIDEWGIHLQEILVQVYGCSASAEDRDIPRVRGTQVCADDLEEIPTKFGSRLQFMVPKVCEQTFGEQNAI